MLRYILKRFLLGLVNLWVFITVLFFLINLVFPYDFTSNVAPSSNAQSYQAATEALREQLGLNLPLWQQYLVWMRNLAHLDLGNSFYGYPVSESFLSLLPNTLLVFLTGIIFAYTLGYWLATLVDRLRKPAIRRIIEAISVSLYTSFPPWLGFLVVLFLNPDGSFLTARMYSGRAFPAMAYDVLWNHVAVTPRQVMLIMVLLFTGVWFLLGLLGKYFYKRFRVRIWSGVWLIAAMTVAYGVLAAVGLRAQTVSIASEAGYAFLTYILLSTGETMMILRNSMAETRGEEFIRTARAIGLPEQDVQERHLARNAILPVISNAMVNFPYLLTGFVMIEKATGWSGLGTVYFISLTTMDVPMILGWLVFIGLITFTLHILLDILHAVLDPRIRAKIEMKEEL